MKHMVRGGFYTWGWHLGLLCVGMCPLIFKFGAVLRKNSHPKSYIMLKIAQIRTLVVEILAVCVTKDGFSVLKMSHPPQGNVP